MGRDTRILPGVALLAVAALFIIGNGLSLVSVAGTHRIEFLKARATNPQDVCRVQFVFAGPKYDYSQFPNLQTWIRYTDPKCSIEILRPYHRFITQLTAAEKRMFYDMAYLPILQADMLKLLAVYYLGGVSADLDVEVVKPFPQAWQGDDTPFATCDVILGIETACYDDDCVKNYVRKGQIQNWAMFARRPRSHFLGELVSYIVNKYDTFPSHDKNVAVQEVAGSGSITDFVQIYGEFDKPHYRVQTTPSGGTLESDPTSVLRIKKNREEVCIAGALYTSGECSGHAECMIAAVHAQRILAPTVTMRRRERKETCRVQFVFTGPKYNYNNFPTLQSWIHYGDPKCQIELLRTNHPLIAKLPPRRARMFHEVDFLSIIQADMLKLFAVYYLGGLAIDLDVEALKPYPQQWVGPGTTLATCDVVLGIEVNCFDDICARTMVRKGQIQNWAMYSRRLRSPFLNELIDYIVEKYESVAPLPHNVSVQEVAGSGLITDFVQIYGNFTRPFYRFRTPPHGNSLFSLPSSVLRINKSGEEVCIVGASYTGGACGGLPECLLRHKYENSWRSSTS
ncbi:unnamed protein product [Aphanomyces euteiches]